MFMGTRGGRTTTLPTVQTSPYLLNHILREPGDDGLARFAMAAIGAAVMLHQHAGIVVEPSGAVGLAGIMQESPRLQGQTIATIVCGGNLTLTQMREWLRD